MVPQAANLLLDILQGHFRELVRQLSLLGGLGFSAAHGRACSAALASAPAFSLRSLSRLRNKLRFFPGDGGQVVRVRALVKFPRQMRQMGGLQDQELVDDLVEEVAIVGDDQKRAIVGIQGGFQDFAGGHVEVVGGLVHEDGVGGVEDHFAHGHTGALAAGEHADFFIDGVAGKEQNPGEIAHFLLGGGDSGGLEFFQDVVFQVEGLVFLAEEFEGDAVAPFEIAGIRRVFPGENVQQRGLARAVGADDADASAARDVEREILEERLARIAFGEVIDLEHVEAGGFFHLEVELHSPALTAHGTDQRYGCDEPLLAAAGLEAVEAFLRPRAWVARWPAPNRRMYSSSLAIKACCLSYWHWWAS